MKLQAIWAMLKKEKMGTILNLPGRQWIQIGGKFYPLDGIGTVTPELLYNLLDVPEDKRNNWHIFEMDNEEVPVYLRDGDETERVADPAPFTIMANGEVYQMYQAGADRVVIRTEGLKPLEGETTQTYMRDNIGGHYLVVKSGLLVRAALSGTSSWARQRGLAQAMGDMAELGELIYQTEYQRMDEGEDDED